MRAPLGWLGIVRLGLVQTALGSMVLVTTSTLNRVMIVELGLAAVVPGALVGLHYGVQIARPLWGHGSDRGRRRTPWIVGGMALLALASTGAALATALMAESLVSGLALAILSFVLIGFGIGAAGTSLLALLASAVSAERRPAAATVVWLMMIFGIAVSGIALGALLDPFSLGRLVIVTAGTGVVAVALTLFAVAGIEARQGPALVEAQAERPAGGPVAGFRASLTEAWADPRARLFTIFVFVSMVAYSMQELILEPFAGLVFGLTPGETTTLSGIQNAGVFAGMVLAGVAGSLLSRTFPAILKIIIVGGCILSGLALALLAAGSGAPEDWPLTANVFALGFANGLFAVAAIAAMMSLAGTAGPSRIGLRMGLWGAAQAIGFGLGGFVGTAAVDLFRLAGGTIPFAYGSVLLIEAAIFLVAALIALRVRIAGSPRAARHRQAGGLAGLEPAQ